MRPPFARLDPLDERREVGDRPDLVQHLQHRLVGAAVQRAVEAAAAPARAEYGSACELPIVRIVVVLQFCS
jgi:hypothetical protein